MLIQTNLYSRTLIIWTSIIRISRLSGLFLWSQFGHDYLLVTIKIHSHILFKLQHWKVQSNARFFLLSTSKSSARKHRNYWINLWQFKIGGLGKWEHMVTVNRRHLIIGLQWISPSNCNVDFIRSGCCFTTKIEFFNSCCSSVPWGPLKTF